MSETSLTVGILTVPGRLSLLSRLADSLSDAIDYYEGQVEVLVAGKGIDAAVDTLNQALPSSVDHIKTDGTAPSGRHQLIEAASTEWLLFIDDDCRVDETILTAYDNAITSASGSVAAIYGPLIFEGNRSVAFEAYRFTPFIHPLQIAAWRDRAEWAPTANAAFSVSDVSAVGNFDTDNPIAVSGEDVDIGLRLNEAGYDLITTSEAKVYHTTESWNSVAGNIHRVYTYGLSEAWLAQRYPDRTELMFDSVTSAGSTVAGVILSLAFFSVPFLCLAWVLSLVFRKMTIDPTTSLIAFTLADVYRAVNYMGFARETIRENGTMQDLVRRFVFYRHSYIHPRIRNNGVWHELDKSADGSQ